MIQRWQTVFLAFIAILMLLTLFFPVWEKINNNLDERATLTAWQLVHSRQGVAEVQNTFYIGILAVISALVAILAIFQFQKRTRQLWFCVGLDVSLASTAAAMIYFGYEGEKLFSPSLTRSDNFKTAIYLVVGALVCNLLAKRLIRRDENLVRSADRLR
jgi:ABC-type Fe3+ transport system permease subunit